MYIQKRYGDYRIDHCPFCGRQAVVMNPEKVPVCTEHKNKSLPELKCVCGKPVMLMHGKFGIYFNCMECGNMNAKKIFEMNNLKLDDNNRVDAVNNRVREITLRSDEID
jgi:hypothetical protein